MIDPYAYEERAAILEYEAGYPRESAELIAQHMAETTDGYEGDDDA